MTEGTKTMEVKGYFADDGKFFTSEEHCCDYEFNQIKEKLFDTTLDSNFEKAEDIGDVIYFIPKNQKDIENFIAVNEAYEYSTIGISLNSPISIYKYDERIDGYIDIVKQCKELITEINSVVPNTIPENIF